MYPSGRRPAGWVVCLVACAGLSGAYFATSGGLRDYFYSAVGVVAVVAIFVGARRAERRLPWVLFGIGQTAYLIAELIWWAYEIVGDVPWPNWSDPFFIMAYPFNAAGLIVLLRDRRPGKDSDSLIDAGIVSTIVCLLAWIFLMEPYALDASLSLTEVIVSLAYPLGDVLLIAVIVRMMIGRGGKSSPAFSMLLVGLAAGLIADIVFALEVLGGANHIGLIDLGWLANYALWGAAALHSSAATISRRGGDLRNSLSRRRLAVLTAFALCAPALLGAQWATGSGDRFHIPETMAATIIIFVLVIARMSRMNKSVERRVRQLHEREGELREALDEGQMLAKLLEHQANHDPLTGLANRRIFMETLGRALNGPGGEEVALFFVDLDEFKGVNDRLGHAAGDELLQAVAHRLTHSLRPGDMAARVGGDEFAVMVRKVRDYDAALRVAERMVESMRAPFSLTGDQVSLHASVGVALGEGWLSDPQQLLRNSDTAMYLAKRRGKDRLELFDPEKHSVLLEQRELRMELTSALERREFLVHYQPIVELSTGRIVGAEALVRWNHPTRGLLLPGDFIRLAEEGDQILGLGRFVVHEATLRASEWMEAVGPGRPFTVSVNVSACQLKDKSFVEDVQAALQGSSLEPDRLILEFTESVLIEDEEASVKRLDALRALGVRLAIDDFGTGYSALTYIRRLPAQILKIDKSFIEGIANGAEEPALAQAILKLGSTTNLTTIAEGIETEEQRRVLIGLGCRYGQGFLFERPVDAGTMQQLLYTRHALSSSFAALSEELGAIG